MRQSKVCWILLSYKMNTTLFQKALMILNRWTGLMKIVVPSVPWSFLVSPMAPCAVPPLWQQFDWGLWRAQYKWEKLHLISKGLQTGLCTGTVRVSTAWLWASLKKGHKLNRSYWVQLKGWTPNAFLRV